MTSHTPGPWAFRPVTEREDGGKLVALLLETKDRPVPCNDSCVLAVREDWQGYMLRSERGQADARLIAAAPDLLAALVLAYQRSCERAESRMKWTQKDQVAHEAIAAALALAEGVS